MGSLLRTPLVCRLVAATHHAHTPHTFTPHRRSYDFDNGINYEKMFEAYATTGFQASNLATAIDEVNKMVSRAAAALLCCLW